VILPHLTLNSWSNCFVEPMLLLKFTVHCWIRCSITFTRSVLAYYNPPQNAQPGLSFAHVLHCHRLQFRPPMSCLAMSCPALSFVIVLSCIFIPCDFLCPQLAIPAFSVAPLLQWVSSFLTAHQHIMGYSVPYPLLQQKQPSYMKSQGPLSVT